MTRQQRMATFFDRRAADFDSIYTGNKNWVQRLWDRLTRRNLRYRMEFTLRAGEPWSGQRVLDVGCGSGRYAPAVLTADTVQYDGIDLSGQMLALARRLAAECGTAARCRFLQQDVLEVPEKEQYDTVIANGFFDYVPDPLPVFAHLRLISARLIATFPARWSLRAPWRYCWLRSRGCPARFYDGGDIRRLCHQACFQIVELDRRGPIYMLWARPA